MPEQGKRAAEPRQGKARKATRRVTFTVKGFEEWGIERGDKVTIAMTGEVLPGELGFFSIWHYGHVYKQFRFVAEQDEDCQKFAPSTCVPGGVCLRYRKTQSKCGGSHDGIAYGRICAVERNGRPVETTLALRPYDEREGPATTDLKAHAQAPGEGFVKTLKHPASASPEQKTKALYFLCVHNDSLSNLGLTGTDDVLVYAADDIKPGDAAALELRGTEEPRCGRVVAADAASVTLRDDNGDEVVSRADVVRVGRLDHLHPKKRDRLTPEQRARVKELRDRLAAVGEEDDQILRCTARYELEKQIFDIEHPAGGDPDDWGMWEEKGGEE